MHIVPDRLRQLRKRANLSRKRLAERSKISPRQLQRLESETAPSKVVRERTILELARVLRVDLGVLTGDLPMPEPSSDEELEAGERVQMSALVWPQVYLAYALIRRRYKVNPTTIINLAPLLFTLLAEGSFAWRRRKLEEVQEAAERLYDLGEPGGHLSFAFADFRAKEGAAAEEESIEMNDLFGEDVGEEAFELGYDRTTHNPFADYLREIALKIRKPDVIVVDDEELGYDAPTNFPHYWICEGDIRQIAGGSDKAAWSLKNGHARLGDIPDELWAEDATEQRARWLEEKLPESDPSDLEDLLKGLYSDNAEVDR